MSEFVANVQDRVRNSGLLIFSFVLKIITGSWLGATFATVVHTVAKIGTLSYVFIIVATLGLIFRILKGWSIFGIVVFNLVFFLTAVLLRMYIYMAPEVVI